MSAKDKLNRWYRCAACGRELAFAGVLEMRHELTQTNEAGMKIVYRCACRHNPLRVLYHRDNIATARLTYPNSILLPYTAMGKPEPFTYPTDAAEEAEAWCVWFALALVPINDVPMFIAACRQPGTGGE